MNLEMEKHNEASILVSEFLNEEQKSLLTKRTDELIDELQKSNVQMLIFMDRSARPLSWMFRDQWKKRFPDTQSPMIKFVNIGREKGDVVGWGNASYITEYDDDGEELSESSAKQKYWSKLDSEEYLNKISKDVKKTIKSGAKIMLIDDHSESGYSGDLAREFFKYHFPQLTSGSWLAGSSNNFLWHQFFKSEDEGIFPGGEEWRGIKLPWSTDKSLTLISEDDPENVANVMGKPEIDQEKRRRGLEMRKEIKKIFTEESNVIDFRSTDPEIPLADDQDVIALS